MNKNISASIHNRISTLAHAYLREFHPDILEKLRIKAESEYLHEGRRRDTKTDVMVALNIPIVEVPKPEKTSAYRSSNYWGDPDLPVSSGDDTL